MRKIEKQMVQAVKLKKDFWVSANTCVSYENPGNPHGPRSEIYLHGNHIADYWHDHDEVEVDINTLRRWPTNTTKSRLRALGVNLTCKRGVLYINGEQVA